MSASKGTAAEATSGARHCATGFSWKQTEAGETSCEVSQVEMQASMFLKHVNTVTAGGSGSAKDEHLADEPVGPDGLQELDELDELASLGGGDIGPNGPADEFDLPLALLPRDGGGEAELDFDMTQLLATEDATEQSAEQGPVEWDFGEGVMMSGLDVSDEENAATFGLDSVGLGFSLPPIGTEDDAAENLRFSEFEIDSRFTAAAQELILWHEERLLTDDSSFTCVAASKSSWLATGRDLLWLHEAGQTKIRCSAQGFRIVSLSLLHDTAVYATEQGLLGRRHARASQPEQLGQAPGGGFDASTRLGRQRVGTTERVWLLRAGRLWFSEDLGTHFTPSVDDGITLDVSSYESDLTALVQSEDGFHFRSGTHPNPERDDIRAERKLTLRFSRAKGLRITALGNLVLIWDHDLGAFTSLDGGDTFAECGGIWAPTAAVMGMLDGRPTIWVAAYDAGVDASLVWQITGDAPSGKLIARIERNSDLQGDADAGFPRSRVRGLAWDEGLAQLLAVGTFGISKLSRPA